MSRTDEESKWFSDFIILGGETGSSLAMRSRNFSNLFSDFAPRLQGPENDMRAVSQGYAHEGCCDPSGHSEKRLLIRG